MLVDLDERRHLALARARARQPTRRPRCSRACSLDLAPVVLDVPSDPVAAAQALRSPSSRTRTVEPHPAPTSAPTRSVRRSGCATDGVTARDLSSQVAALARDAGVLGVVVDAHRGARPRRHRRAGARLRPWPPARPTSASSPTPASPLDDGAGLIEFRYAATDEQFPTIAKLRAARRLWARVLELSEAPRPPSQRQHAVTSRPMMSKYDPWVNMLRTTVAAFAAGVGGADAVTVLPVRRARSARPTRSAAGSPATPPRC